MCQILGIEKTRTTPYRPQSDGMIERANRTIETMLGTFVDQNQQNFDELVPFLMMANRSSVHESTEVSRQDGLWTSHQSPHWSSPNMKETYSSE